jgi:hypothetical protein
MSKAKKSAELMLPKTVTLQKITGQLSACSALHHLEEECSADGVYDAGHPEARTDDVLAGM